MGISRRDFLRGTAASALGIAAAGLVPGAAVISASVAAAEGEKAAAPAADSKNPAWLGEAPVILESSISEVWKTDLLIIGAGNGGMMAASVAADNGVDFRVLEQNSVVGDTRHWYGAINSSAAKAAGAEVDISLLRSESSRYTSGKMDQRVLNVWINESAAMHDYLAPILEAAGLVCDFANDKEQEVEHHTRYYCPPQQHFWNDYNPQRNVLLKERIEAKGYYIDFNHSLVCLTKEGNKVTGAIAQNVLTGAYVRVEAAWGVLIATGGYEGNPEMIEALAPIVPKCVTACSFNPSNKGMGIKAAMWAGAERDLEAAPMIFDRGLVAPGVNAGYVVNENGEKVFPSPVRQFNPGTQPFLKVDRDGVRFMDESQPYNDAVHAAARRKGGVYCQVFDSNVVSDVQRFFTLGCSAMTRMQGDALIEKTIEPQVEAGLVKKADTLEELADLLGFTGKAKENFLATCARYNELYDMQEDVDFGKPAYRLSELRKPPYYGLWLGGSLLCTGDALWINEDMQVLTPEREVIENLYATGNAAGTTFVDNYPELFPGMCLGRNLTFAKHVVEKLIRDGMPTGKGPSMAAPVQDNEALTAENCKDGTYTAKGRGINGDIPVSVEIKGGKIVHVTADVSAETPSLGGVAAPKLVEDIVAANGTVGVDTVSGSTITCEGILRAVNDCIKQAL